MTPYYNAAYLVIELTAYAMAIILVSAAITGWIIWRQRTRRERDLEGFRKLLKTGPLTWRLDRIAERLNRW